MAPSSATGSSTSSKKTVYVAITVPTGGERVELRMVNGTSLESLFRPVLFHLAKEWHPHPFRPPMGAPCCLPQHLAKSHKHPSPLHLAALLVASVQRVCSLFDHADCTFSRSVL
nr:unnamed protein product [Leishmania braziliensis]